MIIDENQLLDILDYARHAPSVHNAQPWLFELNNRTVTVHLNEKRALAWGDPIGRQTWISLGCCVEAMAAAGRKFNLEASVEPVQDKSVRVNFRHSKKRPSQDEISQAEAIKRRFSDRSPYSKRAVSGKLVNELKDCRTDKGTSIFITENKKIIEKVAILTASGIRLALSNPDFRKELAGFVAGPFNSSGLGISTGSLRLNAFRGALEPGVIRLGWNTKSNSKNDYRNWSTSPLLVMVLSRGDSRQYWFNAGRTYMRCALLATRLGLRSSTSAAAVEASDFHEDIEAMIGSNQRLQTVMRVGYSHSPPVSSARLPLDKLFT